MTHLQAAADLTTAAKRQFEFVIQSDLTAYGDTRLLEIALTNLLENASKLTGSKSVVRIEFSQTVANGQPAYFARDNGVDFEPAYTRNLSGAFQRLHSLANLPAQSGLATVQRMIHHHGGAIRAEAAVDQARRFTSH